MVLTKKDVEARVGRFARDWSLASSHMLYWFLYAVALAGSIYGAKRIDEAKVFVDIDEQPLVLAAVADGIGTFLIFLSAILVYNTSMYDPFWSLLPPCVCIYWVVVAEVDGKDVPFSRTMLVMISVLFWAVRLTSNFIRDWPGLHHEDFRYINIHVTLGNTIGEVGYWIIGSLLALTFFPTILVFLGCIPFYFALYLGVKDGANPLNALDFVATVVALVGVTLSFVADEQMRRFRRSPHPAKSFMESGLWEYSRHPNYFGELLFWLAGFLHAIAANRDLWWTGAGFVGITMLVVLASIPMMEERMLKKRPGYKRVMQTTSRLIPLPQFPTTTKDD